jgi:hypothetical protein
MDSCILLYRHKDDILISDSNKNVTFHELREQNQTLISHRVTYMDNGTYTCKVSNGINEIQRKIQLRVMRKYGLTLFVLKCLMSVNYISNYQCKLISDWCNPHCEVVYFCMFARTVPSTNS